MNGFVFYDLETTGTNTASCKIVEMCFASREGMLLHALINPGCVIPKSASDVHGITSEDVRGALSFGDYANEVQQIIDESTVLVGFNNYKFDSVVLDRELTVAGMPGLKKDSHGVVIHPEADLFALWKKQEKRSLITAARRFAGVDLEDAHSAMADTTVLPDVLSGMISEWDLEDTSVISASQEDGAVDREGKFVMDEDGTILLNFGKFKGQPAAGARDYLKWMLNQDFSPGVKAWCRRILG